MKNKNKPIEQMSIPSKNDLLTGEFTNLSIFNHKNIINLVYILRIYGNSDFCFEYMKNNTTIINKPFIPSVALAV